MTKIQPHARTGGYGQKQENLTTDKQVCANAGRCWIIRAPGILKDTNLKWVKWQVAVVISPAIAVEMLSLNTSTVTPGAPDIVSQ